MAMSDDEKLDILVDTLGELERFRMRASAFRSAVDAQDTAEFLKTRAWKAVQRAGQDLKDSISHVTRVERKLNH